MAKNQINKKNTGNSKTTGNEPQKWYADPRYRSLINTIIFIIIALIFFIVNNTRKEPDHGPYPPTATADSTSTLIR